MLMCSYIERRNLTPLFDQNPLLAGKFYKLLALTLLRRVVAVEKRLVGATAQLAKQFSSTELPAAAAHLPSLRTYRILLVVAPTQSHLRLAKSGHLQYALSKLARTGSLSARRMSAFTNDDVADADND